MHSNLAAIAGRNLEADPKRVTRGRVRKHCPATPQLRPYRLTCRDFWWQTLRWSPAPSRDRGLAIQPLGRKETPKSASPHRIRRSGRPLRRFFLDHTQNLCDTSLQLRVPARDQGFWIVLHHDVRIDAVPLDNPAPI